MPASTAAAQAKVIGFDDLDFQPHRNIPDGVQGKAFFANGYGVSVVRNSMSYGGDEGLYELGVMAGDAAHHRLTYDTPITDDVEGYLTPEDVSRLMADVQALPAVSQ